MHKKRATNNHQIKTQMPLFSKSEHALIQLRFHRPSTQITYSKKRIWNLTTEFTGCSWRVLVSENLVPPAMEKSRCRSAITEGWTSTICSLLSLGIFSVFRRNMRWRSGNHSTSTSPAAGATSASSASTLSLSTPQANQVPAAQLWGRLGAEGFALYKATQWSSLLLRRANAALQPCRRGHNYGINARKPSAVPWRDGASVPWDELAPHDTASQHTGVIKSLTWTAMQSSLGKRT